jgi:hypothetical protein
MHVIAMLAANRRGSADSSGSQQRISSVDRTGAHGGELAPKLRTVVQQLARRRRIHPQPTARPGSATWTVVPAKDVKDHPDRVSARALRAERHAPCHGTFAATLHAFGNGRADVKFTPQMVGELRGSTLSISWTVGGPMSSTHGFGSGAKRP